MSQVVSYNGYGESTGISNQVNGKRSYDYTLNHNLAGQIIGKDETLSDGTSNTFVYGYDNKRRLTSVTKNSVQIESYSYDANGNRELQTNSLTGTSDQAATFNIADQQLTDGNAHFEYDTNGRLSKKTNGTAIEEYVYGSQGRLLSVKFFTGLVLDKTISYQHNALGNRVAKLVDGSVIEKYLWLNKTTLLATYDQSNNLKQRFEYGIGHTPVKFTQDNTTYYITTDHLGSPRTITDESGTVIKAIEYDSFGNVIADSNESFEIPFGFAGGLRDSDTNLLRFGYRDYDPQIGRWTARDPIGFAGGDTNLYGYVASDPVLFLDAAGLEAQSYQSVAVTINVGGGLGVSSAVVYSPSGVSAYVGFGFVAGVGVSIVGSANASNHSGGVDVGVKASISGGTGIIGGSASVTALTQGQTFSAGGGWGLGLGAGATIGLSGPLGVPFDKLPFVSEEVKKTVCNSNPAWCSGEYVDEETDHDC